MILGVPGCLVGTPGVRSGVGDFGDGIVTFVQAFSLGARRMVCPDRPAPLTPSALGRHHPGLRSSSYAAEMHAEQMCEEYPVVGLDSAALEAARLLAGRRLPGIVVTDPVGIPTSILPASQVVRFLVPSYVQDDPSLAGVLGESLADRMSDKLAGKTVRSLLPDDPPELPLVQYDDTIVEVAAVMARLRSPLVAVMRGKSMIGVITASRLLEIACRAS